MSKGHPGGGVPAVDRPGAGSGPAGARANLVLRAVGLTKRDGRVVALLADYIQESNEITPASGDAAQPPGNN